VKGQLFGAPTMDSGDFGNPFSQISENKGFMTYFISDKTDHRFASRVEVVIFSTAC
jgi:hypothetical protein